MAIQCPVCHKGTIKKGEKFAYCSERKTEKRGNDFIDIGCRFKIHFDQTKVFGEKLNTQDIKKLLNNETLVSRKGHKMTLDLTNQDFFTKIEFAPKKEDEDL